jgi:hypothetical protein
VAGRLGDATSDSDPSGPGQGAFLLISDLDKNATSKIAKIRRQTPIRNPKKFSTKAFAKKKTGA